MMQVTKPGSLMLRMGYLETPQRPLSTHWPRFFILVCNFDSPLFASARKLLITLAFAFPHLSRSSIDSFMSEFIAPDSIDHN
jgi:hypothetical protein